MIATDPGETINDFCIGLCAAVDVLGLLEALEELPPEEGALPEFDGRLEVEGDEEPVDVLGLFVDVDGLLAEVLPLELDGLDVVPVVGLDELDVDGLDAVELLVDVEGRVFVFGRLELELDELPPELDPPDVDALDDTWLDAAGFDAVLEVEAPAEDGFVATTVVVVVSSSFFSSSSTSVHNDSSVVDVPSVLSISSSGKPTTSSASL